MFWSNGTGQDYSASQTAEAVGIDKRLIYSWINKTANDNSEDVYLIHLPVVFIPTYSCALLITKRLNG